jgi:signal transduction histidine kinase
MRLRLPGSLTTRIALAAVAAVALVGAVAAPVLLAAIERDGRDAVDRELRERAERVAPPGPPPGAPRPGFGGGPPPFGGLGGGRRGPPPRDREEDRLLAGSGTFVQVESGDEVVRRIGDVPGDPPDVPNTTGFATVDIGGNEWRSLTVDAPRGADGRVQLLSTLEPVEDRVGRVRRIVILLGLAALLATGLAAWAFTSVATRPLARLRAGAARVSGTEDLTARLPEDEGPDEVRSLAGALNGMLSRLSGSMQATRRFAADAGHELRTPLTGMQANLDALDRNPDLPADQRAELVRETLDEQHRIVALLDGLQALARGEAAESLPREDVELADLIDTAVFGARRRHPGVEYELVDDIGGATVHGWPGGLRLIVDNLLDNAALHGGGLVRVGLEEHAGELVVRVDDDGAGIPAEQRDRLLEPFARGAGAAATSGTGLGLAIVAQQVALHGGTLKLGDSPLGGLGVEVRLPAAARDRSAG